MKLVLLMAPHQSAESMDLILNYDIACESSMHAIRPLLYVLNQSASRPLNAEEQILCCELAGFYAVLCRQVSYIKFSDEYEVQRWAIEQAFERLVSVPTLRTFVRMLLFDLQIDAGTSHGSYISHLFGDLAPRRERMRTDCLIILSEIVQRCPGKLSYECLEAIHHARVFSHYPVRVSAQYELLDDVNTGHFRTTLELLLSEHGSRAERILQLAVVRWWNPSRHMDQPPVRQVVAITNYAFYIIDKPAGIREPYTPEVEYHHTKGGRIHIEVKKHYRDLTRIVKGLPSGDWFAIGWREDSGGKGEYSINEVFDLLICDKVLLAAPMIDCLHSVSGPVEDDRVDILKDMVMKECLATIIKPKLIQAAAFAYREPVDAEQRKKDKDRDKKKVNLKDRYQGLFIITLTYFYEIRVDWKYWFCLDPLIYKEAAGIREADDLEEDEEGKKNRLQGSAGCLESTGGALGNFVGWMEDEDQSWAHDRLKEDRSQAIENSSSAMPAWMEKLVRGDKPSVQEKRLDAARSNLLELQFKAKIEDISEVEFGGGEESTVEMTFKKGSGANRVVEIVKLCFTDDTGREQWRRSLAKALNRTDESNAWMRLWKT
ncbi:leucine rich repeat-containing protein [Cystoisospora suis]|uniref:Leucine rich repeat-containing protein n=1 Tax=Cystoisospora suis TaxID=483139 RepID=A0A2C6L3M8_9APIC|nr:leucine rich repeat-containing protein [Cystoisospora suis]